MKTGIAYRATPVNVNTAARSSNELMAPPASVPWKLQVEGWTVSVNVAVGRDGGMLAVLKVAESACNSGCS